MADGVVEPSESRQSRTKEDLEDLEKDDCAPAPKRFRLDLDAEYNLEERLNGILCCSACFDVPNITFYQCMNGHLLCSSCLSQLLTESRMKDNAAATCPQCRCDISRTLCSRNLAVEKVISELPASCPFCQKLIPRNALPTHVKDQCQERLVQCKYSSIGCDWMGESRSRPMHEESCGYPAKTGLELADSILQLEERKNKEVRVYRRLVDLLSYEKVVLHDIKLRLCRKPIEGLPTPYYETTRFSAHDLNWVIRACIRDRPQEKPTDVALRSFGYQLVLKTKPQQHVRLFYTVLKGPFGEVTLDPTLYEFRFSGDAMESPFCDVLFPDLSSIAILLAANKINLRVAMIQVKK